MFNRLSHRLSAPIAAGLIGLIVVGCGGGNDSTTAGNSTLVTANQACTKNSAKIGQTAVLSTKAHVVSGTATVLDDCTIEIKNFNYDGGGLPDVFVYGAKASNYAAGFAIGSNLFGTRRTNETIRLTLKTGELDNLDGISIWCVRAAASFGDGSFKQ
jgi:Electron transfer DM13